MQITTTQLGFNGYAEIFDDVNEPAGFIVLSTGKNSKKTQTVGGLLPLIAQSIDPNANCIYTRKEATMHRENTLPAFRWGLREMTRITGFDYESAYQIRETPKVHAKLPNGSAIHFLPFNIAELNRTAVKPANENGYNALVIMDEVIEQSDGDMSTDDIDAHIEALKVMCDTLFRDNPKDTILKPKVVAMLNPWTGMNWVNTVFLNNNVIEDLEVLEKDGRQYIYLPNFEIPGIPLKGLKIIIANRLINEFLPNDNIVNALMTKYTDHKAYLTQVMGVRGRLKGGIYADILKYITKTSAKQVNDNALYFTAGLDYGTVEDTTALVLTAHYHKEFNKPRKMTVAGGVKHKNKNNPFPLTDKEQMLKMVKGLQELAEKYPKIKNGITVYVDAHAHTIAQMFLDICLQENMDYVIVQLSKKPKIQTRIQTERQLISSQCIDYVEDEATSELIYEMTISKYTTTGDRIDQNDHFINAWEYAWTSLTDLI